MSKKLFTMQRVDENGNAVDMYPKTSSGQVEGFNSSVESIVGGLTASDSVKGVSKIYTTTGQNTDGTMTQKAITDALDDKMDSRDYTVFTGATSVAGGAAGKVPAPSAGDENKFLCGNGTWTAIAGGGSSGGSSGVSYIGVQVKTGTDTYTEVVAASAGSVIGIKLKDNSGNYIDL